jgi:DNA-binding transcriptional MerR regulator
VAPKPDGDPVPSELRPEVLADRLGVNVRTLRTWIRAGLVPRPPYHGHKTRFDRAGIVRAYAVAALRRDGVPFEHVRRFIKQKSDAQLREIGGLPPAPVAEPEPAPPPPVAPPIERAPPALPAENVRALEGDVVPHATLHEEPIGPHGSTWRRIELMPGLELHIRSDASPFAQGLAAAIASGRLPK